jgi:1-acyl-sn-glycerol-3-phosphate acyltransferase
MKHSAVATGINFVRSLLWWLLFAISTAVYAVLIIPTLLLPPVPRFRFVSYWARFVIGALRWICGVRYQVDGREHLPEGAAIVLSNHQSTWETFAYPFLFPPQVYVVKKELLRIPFFGWGLAMNRAIAIDRSAGSSAMEQVVTQGRDRLQQGLWVMVFPEGTRVKPGEKKRYKLGGATLAAETDYPVVPVAHNAGTLWPRHQFIKRPGLITVRIGPVISTEGLSAEEINRRAQSWIEPQLAELNKKNIS